MRKEVVVANLMSNSVSVWKHWGAQRRTSVRVQNIRGESSTQGLWTQGRIVRPGSHTYGSDCPPVGPSRVRRTQPAPAAVRTASFSPSQFTSVRQECRCLTVDLCFWFSWASLLCTANFCSFHFRCILRCVSSGMCHGPTGMRHGLMATRSCGWKQHVPQNHLHPLLHFLPPQSSFKNWPSV